MSALKNIICVAAVFAVVGLLGAVPCFADTIQLIQNPSFEQGIDPGNYTGGQGGNGYAAPAIGPGSATSPVCYWTLTRPGISYFSWYMNASYGANQDGSRGIDFAAQSSSESVSQSFAVLTGQTYNVSYYGKYRNSGSVLTMTLGLDGGATFTSVTPGSVAPDGAGSGTLTANSTGTSGWTNYTYTFIPSASANATISFTNSSASGEQFLDNVTVMGPSAPVPEPGTLALLAAGLAGLVCYAWRKQR